MPLKSEYPQYPRTFQALSNFSLPTKILGRSPWPCGRCRCLIPGYGPLTIQDVSSPDETDDTCPVARAEWLGLILRHEPPLAVSQRNEHFLKSWAMPVSTLLHLPPTRRAFHRQRPRCTSLPAAGWPKSGILSTSCMKSTAAVMGK